MRYMEIASCALLLSISLGAQAADFSRDRPDSTPTDERYVAGLGEIMAATQMRHAKLWFAANAANWRLAAFELNEIEEGFEDAMKFHPTFKSIPVAALLDSFTQQPILKLKAAIESEDDHRFDAAYSDLTSACNSCHKAANRDFIVITTPSISPVSNQRYALDSDD